MRSKKIGFKALLFNRRVLGTLDPRYNYREGIQTVAHVLLGYRKLRDIRREELDRFWDDKTFELSTTHKLATEAIRFIE